MGLGAVAQVAGHLDEAKVAHQKSCRGWEARRGHSWQRRKLNSRELSCSLAVPERLRASLRHSRRARLLPTGLLCSGAGDARGVAAAAASGPRPQPQQLGGGFEAQRRVCERPRRLHSLPRNSGPPLHALRLVLPFGPFFSIYAHVCLQETNNPTHSRTAVTLMNLGDCRRDLGAPQEVEPLLVAFTCAPLSPPRQPSRARLRAPTIPALHFFRTKSGSGVLRARVGAAAGCGAARDPRRGSTSLPPRVTS